MADRKISDLTALTTPAAGDYLPIVDISESVASSKNKRITIEELFRGIPLGTAAAPSIAIEGDENTGIYSPGADQLAISTGGSGRLFVDASGNIGVASSSVQSLGANYSTLEIKGKSGGYGGGIILSPSDAATVPAVWYYDGACNFGSLNSTPVSFLTNGSERLRITSAGLVGVGTSSPQVLLHGQITSTTSTNTEVFRLTDNALCDFRVFLDRGTALGNSTTRLKTANGILSFETSDTPRVTIDASGRVGIGTSSPATTLDVNGSAQVTGSVSGFGGGEIRLGPTTANTQSAITTQATGAPALIFDHRGTSNTGTFAWRNGTGGANSLMTLDGSGRLGIGTTSPSQRLTIGATNGYPVIDFQNSGTAYGDIGWQTGTGMVLSGYTTTPICFFTNSTERARIDSSGRLLVGTSSARTFGTTGSAPLLEVESSTNPSLSITRTGADQYGSYLGLGKIRSTSIVNSGDDIGIIGFEGYDGSALKPAASITAQVDGTPGANDMPGRLVFSTTADGASSPTERMRISQTGMCSINTTLAENSAYFDGKLRVLNSGTGTSFGTTGAAAQIVQTQWHQATTGDNGFTVFGTEATFTVRGSISYNRTGGVVAYNTTSDYRAKTIVGDIQNPGETIDALKVYRGVMNGATVERPMLIAHEAQEVAPYCVTGEKDAVDADGKPIYQQMDHQVLVPLLIAEIQQLRARVAALEGA